MFSYFPNKMSTYFFFSSEKKKEKIKVQVSIRNKSFNRKAIPGGKARFLEEFGGVGGTTKPLLDVDG